MFFWIRPIPGFPQEYQVILADTGEVIEFCDPRIQQIMATLEELFGIEELHHSLQIYAWKMADQESP